MSTYTLPTCPTCHQTDQIQKVTSVYNVNTKVWTETRTRTDAWGHQDTYSEQKEAHSALGLKLKPPPEPAGPTHPGLWYGIGGVVAFFLASTLCPICGTPASFLVPLFTGSVFLPDIFGQPAWITLAGVIGVSVLCLAVGGVALGIWLVRLVMGRFAQDMARYRAKKAVFDAEDWPRWQRARERWDLLYYCMRDETVFIPSEGRAINAADTEKYLYNPYFTSS